MTWKKSVPAKRHPGARMMMTKFRVLYLSKIRGRGSPGHRTCALSLLIFIIIYVAILSLYII